MLHLLEYRDLKNIYILVISCLSKFKHSRCRVSGGLEKFSPPEELRACWKRMDGAVADEQVSVVHFNACLNAMTH